MVEVHFINVGCGNMVLMHLSAGTTMLYDCNVTDENAGDVLTYLGQAMGDKSHIDIFVCSHRDSDHMRGIKRVHRLYEIRKLWDSGVPGTTPDSPEYHQYMDLRRSLPVVVEAEARKKSTFGDSVVRCMNSKDSDYTDANEQSIVLKIEYKGSSPCSSRAIPTIARGRRRSCLGTEMQWPALSCLQLTTDRSAFSMTPHTQGTSIISRRSALP